MSPETLFRDNNHPSRNGIHQPQAPMNFQTQVTHPQSTIIPGQNALPSVLYLDHAQVKLLCRRLLHIKEKLDNENMEFLKTKPGKFGSTLMLDESKVSIV
jgi:hypothetical protein